MTRDQRMSAARRALENLDAIWLFQSDAPLLDEYEEALFKFVKARVQAILDADWNAKQGKKAA